MVYIIKVVTKNIKIAVCPQAKNTSIHSGAIGY